MIIGRGQARQSVPKCVLIPRLCIPPFPSTRLLKLISPLGRSRFWLPGPVFTRARSLSHSLSPSVSRGFVVVRSSAAIYLAATYCLPVAMFRANCTFVVGVLNWRLALAFRLNLAALVRSFSLSRSRCFSHSPSLSLRLALFALFFLHTDGVMML